jgi:hypothetical protein
MSSPNMNLPIPVPSQTGGPQYAQNEVSCFNQIDSHNHTAGQGVPIPINGINVNQNLSMNGLSVTDLKSTKFLNQAISPGSSSLYMLGNDLYWSDGTGAFNVQITSAMPLPYLEPWIFRSSFWNCKCRLHSTYRKL